MTIDSIWEQKYAQGHQERYPWDLVVSFVFRHRPRTKSIESTSILEVGFGSGSNLWFASREGFITAGIEGSPSAVQQAKQLFLSDELVGDLRCGDFTRLPFADNSFDLAIDRGSLVCVNKAEQREALNEVRRCLVLGGRFLFNAYTDNHTSALSGHLLDDGSTNLISGGSLQGVGSLTFLSRSDITTLFAQGWKLISVQRKEIMDQLYPSLDLHSEWIVVAEKT